MKRKKRKPRTVSEYIQGVPQEGRSKLRQMRACVRAAATGAKEALKWSMPALVQGRILVMYGGFQRHIGFFPTAKVVSAFKKDLAKYKTGRGSIQFPYDKPLPTALIRRMVKTRVLENRERSGTWRP